MNHIAFGLNEYLRRSSIAGKADGHANNKVVMFLAGARRDTVPGRSGDSHVLARNASTYLNPYMTVAANFTGKRYPDSLKYLSRIIAFFRQHPALDRNSNPAMDERIDRLLDRRALINIWGMVGGSDMPPMLSRVRMMSIKSNGVTGRQHTVSEPDVAAHHAKGE